MPDQDDQGGILAILANRALGDQVANRELVHISRDAGLFDPLRQMVHPARKNRTERASEQVGAHVRRGARLSGGGRRCRSRARAWAGPRRMEGQKQEARGKHCPGNDRCNLKPLDHALLPVPRCPGTRIILAHDRFRLNQNRLIGPCAGRRPNACVSRLMAVELAESEARSKPRPGTGRSTVERISIDLSSGP